MFGQLMKACNHKELLMLKGRHSISIDEWKGTLVRWSDASRNLVKVYRLVISFCDFPLLCSSIFLSYAHCSWRQKLTLTFFLSLSFSSACLRQVCNGTHTWICRLVYVLEFLRWLMTPVIYSCFLKIFFLYFFFSSSCLAPNSSLLFIFFSLMGFRKVKPW